MNPYDGETHLHLCGHVLSKVVRERDELRALLREVWDGCQEIEELVAAIERREWWSRCKAALGEEGKP